MTRFSIAFAFRAIELPDASIPAGFGESTLAPCSSLLRLHRL